MEQQTSTTASVTTRSVGTRYGLIAGVISIAFFLVLAVSGAIGDGYWNWLGYLITAVIVFLSHQYFKQNTDGFMTYGQGVGISLWLGLIGSGISSIFSYIYIKFIDTTFSENMKDKQIQAMQEKGMSDQQIDQAMNIASAFMTPEAILIMGLIFGVLGTIVIGLIVSIFTQKKHPETAI